MFEILTIAKIKNNHKKAGKFFFEPNAMRFFNSKVYNEVYGEFFITSERRNMQEPRLYTVRRAVNGGETIETVGEFQEYATLAQARKAARKLYAES